MQCFSPTLRCTAIRYETSRGGEFVDVLDFAVARSGRQHSRCGLIEAAIERPAQAPTEAGLALRDIWLLRLRALVARAQGDAAAHAHFRDQYRDKTKSPGFQGHILWAEALV